MKINECLEAFAFSAKRHFTGMVLEIYIRLVGVLDKINGEFGACPYAD